MVKVLSASAFETKILPVISRLLKRSADSALPALVWLLQSVSLDLGKHSKDLTTALFEQLKSKTPAQRTFVSSSRSVIVIYR
jgi:hypothetical protein